MRAFVGIIAVVTLAWIAGITWVHFDDTNHFTEVAERLGR